MPVAARTAQAGLEHMIPLCQRRDSFKRLLFTLPGRQIQISIQIHLLRHIPEQFFYG